MRGLGRFVLGGLIGLGLGYALTLLFYPMALRRRRTARRLTIARSDETRESSRAA